MDAACNLAISYIRFSTKPQDLGDSKRRQVDDTDRFCERHRLYLDPAYSWADLGVSGYLGKNARTGELSDFLEVLRAGRIPKGAVLVIESLDRLGRDEIDPTYDRIRQILRSGVRIGNIHRDKIIDANSLNDLPTIMELMIEAMRSYDESKRKSEHGKGKWAERRKLMAAGIPVTTNCAPWLQPTADHTGWIKREDRIQLIRRIVDDCLDGSSGADIARALNAEKVPTFGHATNPKKRAKCWHAAYIIALLQDRRLIGEVKTATREGDKRIPNSVIPNYYPPILSVDQFAQVQLTLRERGAKKGRRERQDRVNIFRGLLWSSNHFTSGQPFGFEATTARKRTRTSLVLRKGDGSKRWITSFSYPHFEQAFLTFVKELKVADFTGKADPHAERLATLSGQMTLINEKIDATMEAIKAAPSRSATTALLDVRTDLEAERDGIKAAYDEAAIRARSPVIEAMADAQSLIGLLSDDPNGLRRRIRSRLRQLVERITLAVFDHTDKCRYGFVDVYFHDGSQRRWWTSYSLTPSPVNRAGEVPRELLGEHTGGYLYVFD
jgi:DNA invertase Pin-like site-specific DNA recombinase